MQGGLDEGCSSACRIVGGQERIGALVRDITLEPPNTAIVRGYELWTQLESILYVGDFNAKEYTSLTVPTVQWFHGLPCLSDSRYWFAKHLRMFMEGPSVMLYDKGFLTP